MNPPQACGFESVSCSAGPSRTMESGLALQNLPPGPDPAQPLRRRVARALLTLQAATTQHRTAGVAERLGGPLSLPAAIDSTLLPSV